jgi:phospholipid/cholesterol/gamma-HCH transport system substrate-binding protein
VITERPLLKFSIFAGICVAIGLWITSMIGNIAFLESHDTYEAVFDDATGVLENDEVRVAGVPVGRVRSTELERGQAVVTFTVRDDITLPEQTTVGVRWRGIVGLRYVYLYPEGEGELEPGHRFPVERTFSPASIGVALERIVPVMRALEPEVQNEFIQALEEALVGQEAEIRQLVDEAAELTQTLAGREEEIGRLIQNAGILTQALARQDDSVRSWLGDFVEAAEGIAERNDMLEDFILEVGDQQDELANFFETNQDGIRLALASLDEITRVIEANLDDFEDVLKYSGHGIIPYHLMSRWGNYFLVNFIGTTIGEEGEQTDGRGSALPPRQEHGDTTGDGADAGGQDGSGSVEDEGTGMSALFVQPLGDGEGVR